jgi:hydroxymethylglutaryl-CoA lyase
MTANTSAVRIVEVGPRDGLQNVNGFIPTTTKIELISRLREAGLQTIEITSVVNPKAIPQLADCRSVLSNPTVAALQNHKSLRLPVLIPNLKGLEIAAKHGVKEIAVFVSATEAFSQANIKCGVEEGLRRATEVAAAAKLAGMAVRGCVQ